MAVRAVLEEYNKPNFVLFSINKLFVNFMSQKVNFQN